MATRNSNCFIEISQVFNDILIHLIVGGADGKRTGQVT